MAQPTRRYHVWSALRSSSLRLDAAPVDYALVALYFVFVLGIGLFELAGKQPDVTPGPPLEGGPTVVVDTPATQPAEKPQG